MKNKSIFQVSILLLINVLQYSLMGKNRYKNIFKQIKKKTSENNFSHIFYLIMWLTFQFQFWKNSHFEIEMIHFQAWLILGNVHKWCRILGGEGGSKMTPKNRTLEGKNRTLGGEGGSKIIENCRTSFMYVPLRCTFWSN